MQMSPICSIIGCSHALGGFWFVPGYNRADVWFASLSCKLNLSPTILKSLHPFFVQLADAARAGHSFSISS